MSAQIINQGNVYGSSRDPGFKTQCVHSAEAHELVYSDGVKAWVAERVAASERFTVPANAQGEVDRILATLHAFETKRRQHTPVDYFGVDGIAS